LFFDKSGAVTYTSGKTVTLLSFKLSSCISYILGTKVSLLSIVVLFVESVFIEGNITCLVTLNASGCSTCGATLGYFKMLVEVSPKYLYIPPI
jgi:hypothetical protein